MASRDKRDRLTLDVGGLRDRLEEQAIEPSQSLASIIRMALHEWLKSKEGKYSHSPVSQRTLNQENYNGDS